MGVRKYTVDSTTLALWAFIVGLIIFYFAVPQPKYTKTSTIGTVTASECLGQMHPMEQIMRPVAKRSIFSNNTQRVQSVEKVPIQDGWINSLPLSFERLREERKVVLLHFWAHGNMSSMRVMPHMQELWERYKDHGLMVIGVHSPEFSFEKDPHHIYNAANRFDVSYPILTDGAQKIWRQFNAEAMPALYLINQDWQIVHAQCNEGGYDEMERVIRGTLQESGYQLPKYGPAGTFLEPAQKRVTRDVYAGHAYIKKAFGNGRQPIVGYSAEYEMPEELQSDRIYLQGKWAAAEEYVENESPGEVVALFTASSVYPLLAPARRAVTVEVLLDGEPVPPEYRGSDIKLRGTRTVMIVNQPRIYYPVAHRMPHSLYALTLKAPAGLRFYSFSFAAY